MNESERINALRVGVKLEVGVARTRQRDYHYSFVDLLFSSLTLHANNRSCSLELELSLASILYFHYYYQVNAHRAQRRAER